MKFKLVVTLLMLSIALNLFILGKWLLIEQWYTPSSEEKIILSEMIQKTVESEDFKRIAEDENIVAIEASMDKRKGGKFPYYFGVSVRTDKQTFIFSCSSKECETMENGEWTYSRYKDEKPRLPFSE
ncbi:hypothetical protein QTL97_14775 [Sporosarcina thermotolerans]|uniref:Lipoprotein n=1 Tax=Sporosarcina thermotolerans TaxID=633404 RepID=A0AAW9AAX8_9BACL|nr:hypothetical protein [Sporosarcina thermotolerans]MDW0118194.1 hypothetical protein [Sporosarcina thermotolerans]WHT47676.1 hypothetical protein QNH10_16325 [Sporosarcina thermotolerans]